MDHLHRLKSVAARKRHIDGWVLQKQESSWAPPGTWSNADLDVVPPERRTWTSWTIFGYWFSDIISIQSWQTGSTILALGLTWREAIFAIVFGSFVMGIPMSLNGYIGAKTHLPFPILARSSFGYHLAKFPVVVRLITALFWHSITNFLAVGPMIQVIRAIWPSFRTLPNTIPESAGITTQQLIAYFVVWTIQFPLLLIPTHRLRPLFTIKIISALCTIVGMTIWTCLQAGSSGDIWAQRASVSGPTRSWLIMWSLNSCTASWSTVGVNIPDFTRFMREPRAALTQSVFFPVICSWVAIIGVVVASASSLVYPDQGYVWDPIVIIDSWEGAGGRAAAFFAGSSWLIAQICVNISATVISGANDLANLFPKWFSIRRGAIAITIVGGWAFVPWKILHSANSLLTFMNSLGIFLAPTMAILITDFFITKHQHLDLPSLYRPHARYHYGNAWGVNWRALLALLAAIGPCLPGLAHAVDPSLPVGKGALHLADFNWYFGFSVAGVVYVALSWLVPARETLVGEMIVGNAGDSESGSESREDKEGPKKEERGKVQIVASSRERVDVQV